MNTHLKNFRRGFTMVELILVLAITGIISVGLAAIVEVPSSFVAQQTQGGPRIASAQDALVALQHDVWFSTNVRLPQAKRLELDELDGSTAVWEWSGTPGTPLTRTSGGDVVDVADGVQQVSFIVQTTSYQSLVRGGVNLVATPIRTGVFGLFTPKAGYTFGPSVPGSTHVDLVTVTKPISTTDFAGIEFAPRLVTDDDAALAVLTVELIRLGAADLDVCVYGSLRTGPNRSRPVARGFLPNGAIPVAMGSVAIPLSSQVKIRNATFYWIELKSAGPGTSAGIQAHYLSIGAAAPAAATTFFHSTNSGTTNTALTAVKAASQTRFSLDAVKAESEATAVAPVNLVTVPTQVTMRLTLPTPSGPSEVVATYPILNAVAQVTQVK